MIEGAGRTGGRSLRNRHPVWVCTSSSGVDGSRLQWTSFIGMGEVAIMTPILVLARGGMAIIAGFLVGLVHEGVVSCSVLFVVPVAVVAQVPWPSRSRRSSR